VTEQELKRRARRLREAEEEAAQARIFRDVGIIQAVAEGRTKAEVAGIVGLTKAAVAKILDKEGAMSAGYSTVDGFINSNGQQVVRRTERPGTDHLQVVYVLRCAACGHAYGANGSDIHLRRCPECQDGRPGLQYE
jgi:hypothetical protein